MNRIAFDDCFEHPFTQKHFTAFAEVAKCFEPFVDWPSFQVEEVTVIRSPISKFRKLKLQNAQQTYRIVNIRDFCS